MNTVLPIASIVLQLVYVVALLSSLVDISQVFQAGGQFESGDPAKAAGAISQAPTPLIISSAIGLVGVFLAWLALRVKGIRPRWFITAIKVLALTWLVFIPVGTIAGFFMLRWNRTETNAHAAT